MDESVFDPFRLHAVDDRFLQLLPFFRRLVSRSRILNFLPFLWCFCGDAGSEEAAAFCGTPSDNSWCDEEEEHDKFVLDRGLGKSIAASGLVLLSLCANSIYELLFRRVDKNNFLS